MANIQKDRRMKAMMAKRVQRVERARREAEAFFMAHSRGRRRGL